MEFKVTARLNNIFLLGSISKIQGAKYAFYIYRNNEKIFEKWYSDENTITYDTKNYSGIYTITGFVELDSKNTSWGESNEVYVFGPNQTVANTNFSNLLGPVALNTDKNIFQCLYSPGKEDRLFVLLSAGPDLEKDISPYFNRWRWRDRFPGHVLCVADPTMSYYDGIEIGWYLGSDTNDVTTDLSLLVTDIAAKLKIRPEQISFYGSSAGGFAALALASLLEGSCGVAINPQIAISEFWPRFYAKTFELCFPGKTIDEVNIEFGSRVDLRNRYRNTKARALIVQNTIDTLHWEKHYKPFADIVGLPYATCCNSTRNINSIVYTHESGHASEPEDVFQEIIKFLVDKIKVP